MLCSVLKSEKSSFKGVHFRVLLGVSFAIPVVGPHFVPAPEKPDTSSLLLWNLN